MTQAHIHFGKACGWWGPRVLLFEPGCTGEGLNRARQMAGPLRARSPRRMCSLLVDSVTAGDFVALEDAILSKPPTVYSHDQLPGGREFAERSARARKED